jgi:flavin reductase (DIM6/NTAB) family NADH-FMN oxidoreductase RutF
MNASYRSDGQADLPCVDAGEFRAAMRELAAGVTIVTAGTADGRRGLTATAVCSVSADPPTLLVCVNRSTEGHAAIAQSRAFCVNVVGAEQRSLAERFAGRDGTHGAERFAFGRWDRLVTGVPVLGDAVAAFDCRVIEALSWTTHTIFIGAVAATRVSPARPSLIYRAGAFAPAS